MKVKKTTKKVPSTVSFSLSVILAATLLRPP
jgi:hypothetical protein